MTISVCVPMHNEAYKAADALRQIHATLENLHYYNGYDYEIVFADGGSVDGAVEMVQNVANMEKIEKLKLISTTAFLGNGRLLRDAVRISTGDVVIELDCNLSYGADVIRVFVEKIRKGYDVVLGSRVIGNGGMGAYPLLYRIIHAFYRHYLKLFGGCRASDPSCKAKAFSKTAANRIFALSQANGCSIDYEIPMLARKLRCKITEIPLSPLFTQTYHVSELIPSIKSLGKVSKIKKRIKKLRKKQNRQPA